MGWFLRNHLEISMSLEKGMNWVPYPPSAVATNLIFSSNVKLSKELNQKLR